MSVAVLIITHAPFGRATLEAVCGTLGSLPLPVRVLDLPLDSDLEKMRAEAEHLLQELDQGAGVLLLTDLFGATPSNLACSLFREGRQLMLVSGLNLSMLIRVMNYPHDDLANLAEKAVGGGINGIYMYTPAMQQESRQHA